MKNEFTTQVNLALIAFAKQAYYEAIVELQQAYTNDNLWAEDGQLQATTASLTDAVEILTRFTKLPEIEAQDFVYAVLQQMTEAIAPANITNTEAVTQAIVNTRYLVHALHQGLGLLKEQEKPIGTNQNPHIKLGFFLKDGKINVHLYGKISSSPAGLSPQEAQALQDSFLEVMEEGGDYAQMMNTAARLSNQGQYEASNELLAKIIEQYPAEQASSLNLIGANWFFLEDYEKAIDYYVKALEAGESKEMIDFNVWEACRELYKGAETPEEALRWKNYYQRLFPEGKHRF